jgi:hypothetical protein
VISLLANDTVVLRITRLVHVVLLANQEHYYRIYHIVVHHIPLTCFPGSYMSRNGPLTWLRLRRRR